MSAPGADRGAASLLVVAMASVLLLLGAALGVVGALVVAHRTAQSAADLGSLAGAEARQRGEDGCAAAARIAEANGAVLAGCRISGDDVLVTVQVGGPRWLGQSGDLLARARAGPVTAR